MLSSADIPHYCMAILSYHRPPKSLLSESQGPLLALMTGIMMHTIECQAVLTHGNDKGQDSLCLTLWGCAHVHETLIQDETVVDTEEHLALFRLSLCSEALLEKGVHHGSSMSFLRQSNLWHAARATSASWASSQSMMCIGSSFATCTLAFWLTHSCSSKSSSLALASPLSAAPTIAPSSRDWMVSRLWLMGTQLKASVAPLSAPFWYSNSN